MVKKTKTIKEYESMTLAELRSEAQDLKLGNFIELPKRELIIEILKKATNDEGFVFIERRGWSVCFRRSSVAACPCRRLAGRWGFATWSGSAAWRV